MAHQQRTTMNRSNVLETLAGGSIRIRERWPRKDKNRGPPDLPVDFRTSRRVEACLNALNMLQAKRTLYLSPRSLSVPLQFLHDSLPYMVQKDVNIIAPSQNGLFTDPIRQEDINPANARVGRFIRKYGPQICSRRYQFWPIDVNQQDSELYPPQWALVVLHLSWIPGKLNEAGEQLQGGLHHLESYGVLNPDHGQAARDIEDSVSIMLRAVLPAMGVAVDDRTRRHRTWIPPSTYLASLRATLLNPPATLNAPQVPGNFEEWSSGLRVFEMIRIWLERLSEYYCIHPLGYDENVFWHSHSGWFNPDAVRANMIGMAAAMVNRAMNSTTRVAIEPILDHAIEHVASGATYYTETMMPNRRRVTCFHQGEPRGHPMLLDDDPRRNDPGIPPEPLDSGDEINEGDDDDNDDDGGEDDSWHGD